MTDDELRLTPREVDQVERSLEMAATREALRQFLTRWEGRHRADVLMTAIDRAGVFRDADEVRQQGWRNGYAAGFSADGKLKTAELRAAIEALCDKTNDVPWGVRVLHVDDVRALLAGDGADGLREVKHGIWLEAVQAMAWAIDNGPQGGALRYVAEHSPYDDYDRRRAEAEDGHLDALMHEEAGE